MSIENTNVENTQHSTLLKEVVELREKLAMSEIMLNEATETANNLVLATWRERKKEKLAHLAKDQFIASMSHEIRTPLNGIIGFTKILLNNPSLTEEQKKQLSAIKTSGDILLVIINDILDLAKIEAGKMTLESADIDVSEITRQIISTFDTKIKEKEIKLNLTVNESVPNTLLGDSVRISQILFNLISNSLKFTDISGKIDIEIQVLSQNELFHYIEFSISDTGIGIPEDKLTTIFEPFVQTSDDTTRKYGGTGLGLSIVKKIVELMKGTINLTSVLGEGTTFKITIPMKLGIQSVTKQQTPTIKEEQHKPFDQNINILLAEDNTINQLLAQTILTNFGFKHHTVENGKIAYETISSDDHYDIILMDLMMPEMDGFESTQLIRELRDVNKNKIPIIALTADVTLSVIQKCKEFGINDYISKPFDENDLYMKIIHLIEQNK